MTEPTDDVAVKITINLTERDEGSIALRPVGILPYLLLEVADVEQDGPDGESLTVSIEVGGGVPGRPVEDLALFLSAIADELATYTAEEDAEE